jgi:hypothetical protein
MKSNVEAGLLQLREGLPGHVIQADEDSEGGAYVIVEGFEIGESFRPSMSWVGFHMTWPYPDADVYPHFVDPALAYVGAGQAPVEHPDGPLPAAMARGQVMPGFDKPAIQVSRRSQRWQPATDTALHKLLRVVQFLRSR